MEIKRKVEVQVTTHRRYLIRRFPAELQIFCAECGEPMLAADQAANVFKISQRRIFQIVELGGLHLTETKNGVMMICLNSLAAFLGGEGS